VLRPLRRFEAKLIIVENRVLKLLTLFQAEYAMASKIYPFGVGTPLDNCFKLILVAEGFTAAQRGDFAAICQDMLDALLAPSHRRRRIEGFAEPGWARKNSADLTPATGARTTRLYFGIR
jgi:hypothetical protein